MRFILFIIFSLCLPLVMQGQEQNVWTQNDSLKLKKILVGQAEIRINREALRELDRAFSSPRRLFKSQSRSAILLIKDFLLYRPNVFTGKYHISNWDFTNNCLLPNMWTFMKSESCRIFNSLTLKVDIWYLPVKTLGLYNRKSLISKMAERD